MLPVDIELDEHRSKPDVELTSSQVRFLRESGAGIEIHAGSRPGRYDLHASEIVGSVIGDGLRVVIRPKIPSTNVLHLLSLTDEMPDIDEGARLGAEDDLVQLMVAVFVMALERALRAGGIVSGYEERRERSSAVRGRIDALDIARRQFGIVPPVTCTYADLVVDTGLNQRLLAALAAGRTFADTSTTRTIDHLWARFEDVSLVPFGRTLPAIHFDRRTDRFRTALALGDLVLLHASLAVRAGAHDGVAFLVDMNRLFEAFIARALDRSLASFGWAAIRHPADVYLDRGRRLQIEPDLLVLDERGAARVVVDAKYKSTEQARLTDVYQVFSYAKALRLSRGVLVYAQARDHAHEIADATVDVRGVDLGAQPSVLRDRIHGIAKELVTSSAAPLDAQTAPTVS